MINADEIFEWREIGGGGKFIIYLESMNVK